MHVCIYMPMRLIPFSCIMLVWFGHCLHRLFVGVNISAQFRA